MTHPHLACCTPGVHTGGVTHPAADIAPRGLHTRRVRATSHRRVRALVGHPAVQRAADGTRLIGVVEWPGRTIEGHYARLRLPSGRWIRMDDTLTLIVPQA